jgi:hypothetical protein
VASKVKDPSGPVVSSADPIVTVAPGTGDREASTTFPDRVRVGRVVVVVGGTVELVADSETVAGEPVTALVAGPPTSNVTQADAARPKTKRTRNRDREVSSTQAW